MSTIPLATPRVVVAPGELVQQARTLTVGGDVDLITAAFLARAAVETHLRLTGRLAKGEAPASALMAALPKGSRRRELRSAFDAACSCVHNQRRIDLDVADVVQTLSSFVVEG